MWADGQWEIDREMVYSYGDRSYLTVILPSINTYFIPISADAVKSALATKKISTKLSIPSSYWSVLRLSEAGYYGNTK